MFIIIFLIAGVPVPNWKNFMILLSSVSIPLKSYKMAMPQFGKISFLLDKF